VEALHKDGHIFPIELSIWTISDERGEGFGASVRDASERHHAQVTLRNSEERYRSVVEHLGEGMFLVQNNRIVFTNAQASQIMRIPHDEIMGSDPVQWIHHEDRAGVLELRERWM
jgi:PAS domain-containing protein